MLTAATSLENLDTWMEAGLGDGDWRVPLDLTAQAIGADAIVMLCRDQAAGRTTLSACSEASVDFVLRCRELSAQLSATAQVQFASQLGYVAWAAFETGSLEHRLNITLVAQCQSKPPISLLQSAASVAACSVGVKARLDAVKAASALKTAAFNQLPFGVAIVDDQIRAVEMNDACRGMIARGDGLGIVQGKLVCRDRADQAALKRAVSAALRGEANPPIVRIVRPGGAEPYVVRATCAVTREDAHRQCLLMIVDPDGGPTLAGDLWRAMFDLTESELIAVRGLVAGRKPANNTNPRAAAVEPARTQTQRLVERLDV